MKRSRERDLSPRSATVSLLVHVLLALWLLYGVGVDSLLLGEPRGADDGPGQGTGIGAGAAGGGGGGAENVTFYEIPTPPAGADALPTPPPPEPEVPPEPEPEAVVVQPTPAPVVAQPDAPAVTLPGTVAGTQGPSAGPLAGAGTGPGSGPGSGGGSGGGAGGGIGSGVGPGTGRGGGAGEDEISPPVASAVILPPPAPKGVRGRTVTLRLAIDARGRVRDVDLVSSSGDGGYDRRLERTARDWQFSPARDRSGRAVAAPVEISFTF